MGKRRRGGTGTTGFNQGTNQNELSYASSLNSMPCSSGTKLLSGELADASNVKPLSPGMDVTDSTLKLLRMHTNLENQHNVLGRSLLLRQSRHHYGNHYSRRNSGSRASASTSHRMTALLSDSGIRASASTSRGWTNILCDSGDKSASTSLRRSSDPGVHVSASASHGRTSHLCGSGNHASASTSRRIPESVRFSSVTSSASTGVAEMVCGICDKQPRRKQYFPGETRRSSSLFSVVAILACGHVYHADCLEKRTSVDETQDPPCPQCTSCSLLSWSSVAYKY